MSLRTDWKGAVVVALSLAVLGLAACGGGGGATTSGLSKRAFVSDDFDGTLHIEDAQHDVESFSRISTGNQPGTMVLSPDKSITLVFDAGDEQLAVVSNATESALGRIILPSLSTSYVSMADNTVGLVAVSNSNVSPCIPRCVEVVNLATTFSVIGTINVDSTTQLPLNATTTLVLSPTGSKLLVFGGPGEHADTFTVIDTATAETTPATAATQIASPFLDRPVSAVFSSDGNTAYILNCGPECGGKVASVSVLNVSANTLSAPTPVAGATIGLLNGSTLYVAGTPPNQPAGFCPASLSPCGTLSVLDTTALANGPTSSVPISDGYHNHMELASNNKLFIGATPTCTAGCLTIFDTSKNNAGVDTTTGNVTGIAPINGRNVVYVVEDVAAGSFHCQAQSPCLGKLRIYDTTASVPTLTPTQIDVVGKAVDVKYVDH